MSVPGAVCGRVQVLAEVVVILEMSIARGTVMVLFRLAIVFLQSVVISENPSAVAAEIVASLVVVFKFVSVVEVVVTATTVGVVRALTPMLLHATQSRVVVTTAKMVG